MGNNLEFFANNRYKLLTVLFDNQIKVKDESYVRLSQQEIADIAHFSKFKTNKILNELINIGCVEPYRNTRGKYMLTSKAYKIIRLIKKANINGGK